jgi:hypothetical protein
MKEEAAEAPPAETKPAETKPPESKPVETATATPAKPAETKETPPAKADGLVKFRAADGKALDEAKVTAELEQFQTVAKNHRALNSLLDADSLLQQQYLEAVERKGGLNDAGKQRLAALKAQNAPPPPRKTKAEVQAEYDKLMDAGKYSEAADVRDEWRAAEEAEQRRVKDQENGRAAIWKTQTTKELQTLAEMPLVKGLMEKAEGEVYGVKFLNADFRTRFHHLADQWKDVDGSPMSFEACAERAKKDLKLP